MWLTRYALFRKQWQLYVFMSLGLSVTHFFDHRDRFSWCHTYVLQYGHGDANASVFGLAIVLQNQLSYETSIIGIVMSNFPHSNDLHTLVFVIF